MPPVDASIMTTVRHLESVTTEIEKLRDAVASHKATAEGLDKAGIVLADLSQQLERLPSELKLEFAGVSDLVSRLDEALRPAGSLEREIRELVSGNAQLVARLLNEQAELGARIESNKRDSMEVVAQHQREREAMAGEMRSVREEVKELRAHIDEQQTLTREAIQNVMEQSLHSGKRLALLYGELKRGSSAQASNTESMEAKLGKLLELGRRGFLGRLRKTDA